MSYICDTPTPSLSLSDLREFPVTFPENWQVRSLAGQRVTCRITVHEVFKWALEELTDEMAPQIVEGCTTVEEVK